MPCDYKNYPNDWAAIREMILVRAGNRCECFDLCGIPHQPEKRCIEFHRQKALTFTGAVVLTIAHLCFDTQCDDRRHLRALCQRCHNRYDNPHRMRNAAKTRATKREIGNG